MPGFVKLDWLRAAFIQLFRLGASSQRLSAYTAGTAPIQPIQYTAMQPIHYTALFTPPLDENVRQGVVDANRLGPPLALALEDDYYVALEGDITGKMRCFRSEHVIRARRRVGGARIAPHFVAGHHIAQPPGRKLTLGSCCARISWTLRVARLAVVCTEATRVCGTVQGA